MGFQKGHTPWNKKQDAGQPQEVPAGHSAIDVTDIPPEALMEFMSQPGEIVTEEIETEAGATRAVLTYEKPQYIVLYDRHGMPSRVTRENLVQCLREGLRFKCPICNGKHDTSDWNACPKRAKVLYTECPDCMRRYGVVKRIYAEDADTFESKPGQDENFVKVFEDTFNDPRQRLKEKLIMHMLAKHPQEAAARGIRGAA